jgi:hypothetical protein
MTYPSGPKAAARTVPRVNQNSRTSGSATKITSSQTKTLFRFSARVIIRCYSVSVGGGVRRGNPLGLGDEVGLEDGPGFEDGVGVGLGETDGSADGELDGVVEALGEVDGVEDDSGLCDGFCPP